MSFLRAGTPAVFALALLTVSCGGNGGSGGKTGAGGAGGSTSTSTTTSSETTSTSSSSNTTSTTTTSTADAGPPPLDCSTRPPPAGWTRLTSGRIQNYGPMLYLFDIADSTKYANMFGFNDRLAPIGGGSTNAPYNEPEGPPTPVIHPVFPAKPATNAVYGYGPQKMYYALELAVPTFPDASGATSIVSYFTGSSSNYGTVSTLSISECPGDFDPALGPCLMDKFFGEGVEFFFESGSPPGSGPAGNPDICHLKPGKTYYFNMAAGSKGDWSKSSCSATAWCWTTLIALGGTCPGAPNNDCGPLIDGQ